MKRTAKVREEDEKATESVNGFFKKLPHLCMCHDSCWVFFFAFKANYISSFSGSFGLIWFTFWFFLAHETPALHPNISDEERVYIQTAIGTTGQKKVRRVTWVECQREIFRHAKFVFLPIFLLRVIDVFPGKLGISLGFNMNC